MARDFYPFVEEPDTDPNHSDKEYDRPPLEVRYAARIAVYDDKSTTPRVVLIDPKPVRDYLEEITDEVTKLSHEQGGSIPFMVIREIVENFIHAYFVEPTISILDGGNTIRFADQGPGIKEKDRALEYGTSSATEDMRHYIRGVGSGLPYVQQYMDDKGGTLTIDDNIGPGTVVTLSLADADHHESQNAAQPMVPNNQQNPAYLQQAGAQQGYPTYPMQPLYAPQQGYQAQPQMWQTQQPHPEQQSYPVQRQPHQSQPAYSAQHQQAPTPQNPVQQPQQQSQPVAQSMPALQRLPVTERGHQIMEYLSTHESVGPSNLVRAYKGSQPTWSRSLKEIESMGLIKKEGQKYYLTQVGSLFLHMH